MTDPEAQVNKSEDNYPRQGYKLFINILISTFISVFLAELGDKTQIATLLLSAESGKPLQVFIGAALALICSTIVVVILGQWFSTKISQVRVRFVSGILLISLGIWFAIQSCSYFFES